MRLKKSVDQRSVLFVCLGNRCRSPAGEGILQHMINEQGLGDKILVDSAGTAQVDLGARADIRMRVLARVRGYDLQSLARQISPIDFEYFDLLIAMDQKNYRNIVKMRRSPSAKILRLSHFLDRSWPRSVPDPYYGGEEGFEKVLDMLEAACPKIIEYLISK